MRQNTHKKNCENQFGVQSRHSVQFSGGPSSNLICIQIDTETAMHSALLNFGGPMNEFGPIGVIGMDRSALYRCNIKMSPDFFPGVRCESKFSKKTLLILRVELQEFHRISKLFRTWLPRISQLSPCRFFN